MNWISWTAQLLRSHLLEISISLTAILLVILSPYINRAAKSLARPLPWLARYVFFVILATAGFGVLTQVGVRTLGWVLRGMGDGALVGAVVGAHLVLAWFLKRENHI
jgi:hypothetical protein